MRPLHNKHLQKSKKGQDCPFFDFPGGFMRFPIYFVKLLLINLLDTLEVCLAYRKPHKAVNVRIVQWPHNLSRNPNGKT